MSEKQKTIEKEISLKGVGLHTGTNVNVCFKPASVDAGICFIRVDLPGAPKIQAKFSNVLQSAIPRCTSIGQGQAVVHTIEHLMSVSCGLGIDNLTVEIDGNEMPGLDGSGIDFLSALKKAGIKEQIAERRKFIIQEPVWIQQNDASLMALPSDDFRVSYLLDYSHSGVCAQYFSVSLSPELFEKEIAPCRTFCLEDEAEELSKRGLGKGANYENTLVIKDGQVKNNTIRFKDEFARHKILDFIGDIYLLGMPVQAHFIAVKSGHNLNLALLKKIAEQQKKHKIVTPAKPLYYDSSKSINIEGIKKILPHRYPFLLVDRIIDLEQGKRATGVKNITINEYFFQGHFPSRPIMPGILMVEAMAQVAGVAFITDAQHQGKWALFMAADKVKFRKVVVPGDQLVMDVEITRNRSKTAQAKGVGRVQGEVVVEADLMFSFIDEKFLN
ncbi:MAG: bifunctional UDP-3-O-[3-hydroxymyristoyl] N-acetylglucosamine deacetylase/3-hydroxyacyl-ACP dehydratase [Candidatus Omnitrophota bacterium]